MYPDHVLAMSIAIAAYEQLAPEAIEALFNRLNTLICLTPQELAIKLAHTEELELRVS